VTAALKDGKLARRGVKTAKGGTSMDIDEVCAREEIRRTMAQYNMAGDRGLFEDMAATFLDDGVLETRNGPWIGRRAIVEGLTAGRKARGQQDGPKITFTRHNLMTSQVEFTSKTQANAWTYFMVVSNFGPDHTGVYIDTVNKHGERWLFARRRVKLEWDSPHSPYHRAP
jgi:hypothetical protein